MLFENLNEICPQNNLIHLNVYVVIYAQIYRGIELLYTKISKFVGLKMAKVNELLKCNTIGYHWEAVVQKL